MDRNALLALVREPTDRVESEGRDESLDDSQDKLQEVHSAVCQIISKFYLARPDDDDERPIYSYNGLCVKYCISSSMSCLAPRNLLLLCFYPKV